MIREKLQPTISAQTVTSGALEKCKGKTIADWEFGTINLGPHCHLSERVIFHFTDGSKVTFDIAHECAEHFVRPRGTEAF